MKGRIYGRMEARTGGAGNIIALKLPRKKKPTGRRHNYQERKSRLAVGTTAKDIKPHGRRRNCQGYKARFNRAQKKKGEAVFQIYCPMVPPPPRREDSSREPTLRFLCCWYWPNIHVSENMTRCWRMVFLYHELLPGSCPISSL